jgi:hypothetical protein
MSTQMKLLIPLLDKNITKEDLTPEAGFVDVYVFDKNRPSIDNCIFLMYDLSVKTTKAYDRECRFAKCENLHDFKVDYINGKAYKIFAFTISGEDIRNLYNGYKPKKKENVVRILSFWCGYDEDVNNTMLINKPERLSRDWKTIPEYDYRPEAMLAFGYKKGEAL